jgi:hypothetical protein
VPSAKVVRGYKVHNQPAARAVSRRLTSDGHLEVVGELRLSSPEWAAFDCGECLPRMISLVSQIRVIDVTAADEIFAGLEGDNFYSFFRRLRAGVRITLAWPCTCTDRTPRISTLDSPVQHCSPYGSWRGAPLAVVRAVYDGPVFGRTRPSWSHSAFQWVSTPSKDKRDNILRVRIDNPAF